jgi:hypothetical protein
VDRHDQSAGKPAIVKEPAELYELFVGIAGNKVRCVPLKRIMRPEGASDAWVDMDIVPRGILGQKLRVALGGEDVMTDVLVRPGPDLGKEEAFEAQFRDCLVQAVGDGLRCRETIRELDKIERLQPEAPPGLT